MRLLSWNINGIRTLPQYHPWNTLKTGEAILNELKADIICFQEMKSSRVNIEKHAALPDSYDAFFSFPQAKGGYSGVGVYTSIATAIPLKAEEGLSTRLQPKPPLSPEERIAEPSSQPFTVDDIELVPDEDGKTLDSLLELDQEGRALILDFGLFILINLYCPNETSEARLSYKLNFHYLLEARVKRFVQEGREVIVSGDINICADPLDHCDGVLASKKEEFWEHPARKWFRDWLAPRGPMHDVIRSVHPDRAGMYTCWNTKISARESNYGTRIDYFLLTEGLLPWFKHGDIQPSVKGSDHCPIYIDLHDEISIPSGETLRLRDMMKMTPADAGKAEASQSGRIREPPRIATRFWDEYSGKQKLLSSFFGKGKKKSVEPIAQVISSSASRASSQATSDTTEVAPLSLPLDSDLPANTPSTSEVIMYPSLPESSPAGPAMASEPLAPSPPVPSSSSTPAPTPSSPHAVIGSPSQASNRPSSPSRSSASSSMTKRKKVQADSNYPAQATKKQKQKAEEDKRTASQTKLSTFFTKPGHSSSKKKQPDKKGPSKDVIDVDDASEALSTPAAEAGGMHLELESQPQIMADEEYAQLLQEAETSPSSSQSSTECKSAWSALFAPIQPPKCTVHGEPTKMYTVNKQGPNKGKTFFICARPVGPGYDAGRDKRLREEVDPRYRCNYFKWTGEVKKMSLKGTQRVKS